MKTESNRCPDCNMLLRTKPRRNHDYAGNESNYWFRVRKPRRNEERAKLTEYETKLFYVGPGGVLLTDIDTGEYDTSK